MRRMEEQRQFERRMEEMRRNDERQLDGNRGT